MYKGRRLVYNKDMHNDEHMHFCHAAGAWRTSHPLQDSCEPCGDDFGGPEHD